MRRKKGIVLISVGKVTTTTFDRNIEEGQHPTAPHYIWLKWYSIAYSLILLCRPYIDLSDTVHVPSFQATTL